MKTSRNFCVVLVTVPDRKTGRHLAEAILQARLAACVNLVPGLVSHYWWQGRLEQGREILLLIKTSRAQLAKLESRVHQHHPYDTPEFVVLPLAGGSRRYLDWIQSSLTAPRRPTSKSHKN